MEHIAFSSFGDLLKAFRRRRHLTQQAIAAAIGVHRNTISIWERGDYLPASKTVVLDLAQQLHLNGQETRQLLEASLTAIAPHWSVPFARNPYFTGREEAMAHLHTLLRADHHIALTQSYAFSGLGGIGKTQLAVEYAYRYAQEYSAVLWIVAETAESIAASLHQIAVALEVSAQHEPDQQRIVAAVRQWLSAHRQWLLIWDNVEDIDLVTAMLPTALQGTMVFTTRRQTLGTLAPVLEVPPLTEREGIVFLLRRAGLLSLTETEMQFAEIAQAFSDEYAAARELVDRLGGLPLALDQVGAYVKETAGSLADYLRLYQTSRAHLLGQRGNVGSDHPASVVTTWSLIFACVEQVYPAATDLLRTCAFLHAEAIPEEIFTEGANHLGERLGPVAADPLQWNEALRIVLAYSLLTRNAADHTLSMHRLVQAVLRDAMEPAESRQWMERAVHAVNAAFPKGNEFATWPRCERCMPHAYVCKQIIGQMDLPDPSAARLLYEAGSYLLERGRYAEAETFLTQALALWEQQPGSQYAEAADTATRLVWLYWSQGNYEQTEITCKHALDLYERSENTDPLQLAQCLNNLGALYYSQGKYELAEPLYRRTLAIREQQLGPDHHEISAALGNLGILYRDQGKYEAAEPLLQRGLTIYQQQLGVDHPRTASALNNLALLYHDVARYDAAEPLLQRGLTICEQQLGTDHPRTASMANNLALVYYDQKQYELAEPLLQRALNIRRQQLSADHPDVAISLRNLGRLYSNQGRYELAKPLLQQAVTIMEQRLGADHPRTAACISSLGIFYRDQGQYDLAGPLLQRALDIRERQLDANHPDSAASMIDLAIFYEAQENYEQALALLRHAFLIYEQRLGQTHPETIQVREHVGRLANQIGVTT